MKSNEKKMALSYTSGIERGFTTRSVVSEGDGDHRTAKDLWKIAREGTIKKSRLQAIVVAFSTRVEIQHVGDDGAEDNDGVEESPTSAGTGEERFAKSHPRNAGKYTVLAFVNSCSGGGVGKTIFDDLVRLLGSEFVVDLKSVGKGKMPEDHLTKYAMDPNVRVLACGGDGTVGWIASSIDKVWKRVFEVQNVQGVHETDYQRHLPLAVMPLGTGNDLSRQFGWGGVFKDRMREKSMIRSISEGRLALLDRWRCLILPLERLDDDAKAWVPQMLGEKTIDHADTTKSTRESVNLMQELFQGGGVGDGDGATTGFFDGVFCNYFSIGFDATIAFNFHKEREAHPEKFTSPLANKLIYIRKTPGAYRKSPQLRGNMRILVKNEESGEMEKLKVPRRCLALLLLNIQSYGGGSHLTSSVCARPDDGLIEVIFVSSLSRMAAAVGPMKLTVAARTSTVAVRTDRALHCQVDGEPWYQSPSVIQIKHNSRNAFLEKVRMGLDGCCGPNGTPSVVE